MACSLVCQVWHLVILFHIFRTGILWEIIPSKKSPYMLTVLTSGSDIQEKGLLIVLFTPGVRCLYPKWVNYLRFSLTTAISNSKMGGRSFRASRVCALCYSFIIAISNKKFRDLMVRRPAFHTEIRGSIPLAGSFAFSCFFSSFSKKGLSLGLCSSKPPITTNFHHYLQDLQNSVYIFNLYFFWLMPPHICSH